MRTLDYAVIDPAAFFRETLTACPNMHCLKLEGSLPAELVEAFAPFLLENSWWLRWLQPRCYIVPAKDAHSVLEPLCKHARSLRLLYLSLASPQDTHMWFESPHFGQSSTLFLHDHFPDALLRRLLEARSIKLCEWETKRSLM